MQKNNSDRLSHLNERGEAQMVDVSSKPITVRQARAAAKIVMLPATLEAIEAGNSPK
jgi:cyclic pyranopterin monophosphate synthase